MRVDLNMRCRKFFPNVIATVVIVVVLYILTMMPQHPIKLFDWRKSKESVTIGVKTSVADEDLELFPPKSGLVNTTTGRYVSVCNQFYDSKNRLGNQMFFLAAAMQVAALTRRQVVVAPKDDSGWIGRWFDIQPIIKARQNVESELCPCQTLPDAQSLAFDRSLMSTLSNRTDIVNKTLLVCGFFQSWRYTVGVERQLRRLLRPRAELSDAVRMFIEDARPARWKDVRNITRVGIHVRAGDIQSQSMFELGFTIPKRPFFYLAMRNMTDDKTIGTGDNNNNDTRRIQFLVASDSVNWTRNELDLVSIGATLNSSSVDVDVVYSVNASAGFDFVLLASCDAVIMTTGTYGWWAAWLSGSNKVVYYRDWPRPGSAVDHLHERSDFFPPRWIPISGPYYVF